MKCLYCQGGPIYRFHGPGSTGECESCHSRISSVLSLGEKLIDSGMLWRDALKKVKVRQKDSMYTYIKHTLMGYAGYHL